MKKYNRTNKTFGELNVGDVFESGALAKPGEFHRYKKMSPRKAAMISAGASVLADGLMWKNQDPVVVVTETWSYTMELVHERLERNLEDARNTFAEKQRDMADSVMKHGHQAMSYALQWKGEDLVMSEEKLYWTELVAEYIRAAWTPQQMQRNLDEVILRIQKETARWYPNYSTSILSNACEGFRQKARVQLSESFGGFMWITGYVSYAVDDAKYEDAIAANTRFAQGRVIKHVEVRDIDYLVNFCNVDADTAAFLNCEMAKRIEIETASDPQIFQIDAAEMERSVMEPFISDATKALGEGMEELEQVEQEDFNSKK